MHFGPLSARMISGRVNAIELSSSRYLSPILGHLSSLTIYHFEALGHWTKMFKSDALIGFWKLSLSSSCWAVNLKVFKAMAAYRP